jgi:predicted TPR repeat methyltransferase
MTSDGGSRESSLRSFLAERPRNAKAMFQLASLLTEASTQAGDEELREEAISLARRAIQVAPQKPFGYAALSVASFDFAERMESTQQAASLSKDCPHHRIAHVGFLVRLLVQPREEEARLVRGKIGRGAPAHPVKRELGKEENSLYREIQLALSTAWDQVDCNLTSGQKELLCKNEYRLGLFSRKKLPTHVHQPRAKQHFLKSQEIRLPKKFEMAQFWLATLSKGVSIDKCPAEYIVSLYSTFAERFDELLVEKLNYQTPTKLRQLLDKAVAVDGAKQIRSCLDLGCGTGLSGLAFADSVESIAGIDLSPEMLEKAKSRSCYTSLEVGDVTTVLSKYVFAGGKFDLILACDVFCYIGDLSPVFALASRALERSGYFCFSTEHLERDECSPFRLHGCARFAHKCSYIEKLARMNSFEIVQFSTEPIRRNQGDDVQGVLAVLKLQHQHAES